MLMRLLALVLLGSSLLAQEGEKTQPIPEVLVLRRTVIIQDVEKKILAAQLAQAELGAKLAQIDKEAGCVSGVDWAANPPICKGTK